MKVTSWKVYQSRDGFRRVWYDRHYRLWVMQRVDAAGDQEPGECGYTGVKAIAFDWLGRRAK